jgi:hypothetical protein
MPKKEPPHAISSSRAVVYEKVVELWNPEINFIIESLNTASSMLEKAEDDACKDWIKLLQKRIGYLEKDERS